MGGADEVLARREGAPLSPMRARLRRSAALARMVVAIDTLKGEAAEAGIGAEGLAEARQWIEHALMATVADAEEAATC